MYQPLPDLSLGALATFTQTSQLASHTPNTHPRLHSNMFRYVHRLTSTVSIQNIHSGLVFCDHSLQPAHTFTQCSSYRNPKTVGIPHTTTSPEESKQQGSKTSKTITMRAELNVSHLVKNSTKPVNSKFIKHFISQALPSYRCKVSRRAWASFW